MVRRYIVLLTFAMWMGGFTFYTLVVIPTGGKVLGSERDVGFITQQVTQWLNWIGVAALLIFGGNLFADRRAPLRVWLALAWVGMLATELALFVIHPVIDRMLDPSGHKIHGPLVIFFNWHRTYMAVASLQWLAALLYLWLSLAIWRQQDSAATV